jgi:hypothetical protein
MLGSDADAADALATAMVVNVVEFIYYPLSNVISSSTTAFGLPFSHSLRGA